MTISVKRVCSFLEKWAPKELSLEGDNDGFEIGDPNLDVNGILVALDLTDDVVNEAIANNANLIVLHHPFLFNPIKHVRLDKYPGNLIHKLIINGISVYSMHTRLDVASGGVNDTLVEKLKLKDTGILDYTHSEKLFKIVVFVPEGYEDKIRDAMAQGGAGCIGNYSHCTFQVKGAGTFKPMEGTDPFSGQIGELNKEEEYRLETIVKESVLQNVLNKMIEAHPYEEVAYDVYPLKLEGKKEGIGRVGKLQEAQTLKNFGIYVKERLGLRNLRLVGNDDDKVQKVAVCSGSGARYMHTAVRARADVLVTGDVKHHEAVDARRIGFNLIDAGHAGTELPVLEEVVQYLGNMMRNGVMIEDEISIRVYTGQGEPFKYL